MAAGRPGRGITLSTLALALALFVAMVVLIEMGLACYFEYYHQSRTHLALDKDAPEFRPIELPTTGKIVQLPEVGGLHHRYLRQAA